MTDTVTEPTAEEAPSDEPTDPESVSTEPIAEVPVVEDSPPEAEGSSNCDPSYPDDCLEDGNGDYDCSSGSGNGPNYVDGPVRVDGEDPFGLDRDGDGWGCEG